MVKINELKDSERLVDYFGELVTNRTDVGDGLTLNLHFVNIPTEDFNKKFFLVYNGKLRQFKFIKQAHFPFGYAYNTRTINDRDTRVNDAILINVAGIGETWVDCLCYGKVPFDVFESVENYKNGVKYEIAYFNFTLDEMKAAYANIWDFANVGYAYPKVAVYNWDGTKVVRVFPKINVSIGLTWDGDQIETGMDDTMYPFYVTEEECREDNDIEVEYLDGEKEEPKEKRRKGLFVGLAYDLTDDEVKTIKELIKSFAE